jgi:predicted RNA-binding protein with PUA-like domain
MAGVAQRWLVKTEPRSYSFDDLERERSAVWDGVRNPTARRNLESMRKGDLVLVYHTGDEKAVVGVARVAREHFPDPKDARWLAVELTAVKRVAEPVTLSAIKAERAFASIPLVRQPRLSVMPLEASACDRILRMGKTRA